MTAECPLGGAESSPLTPVWVQAGWNTSVPASTGASTRLAYRLAGGRKVVAAVMAAICCTGMLKVTHHHGRPCGADTSDVVSVDQIGKREEPSTDVCDQHT
jgi:hypothetical protein